MKRYLVTLTGRVNCIYGKLRGNELVCSYVHANSKKKAIDLFWGEIEKNENFNCYSRRDFKIEAELWNEDELDHYGNPLKDWESAIEFSNLHLIRFNHCTGKFEIFSAEMEKSEQIKSEEAHQLAQAVAQMDADQVCSIIEETLRKPQESSEPVAQENIQPELENATESISEPHSEIWELAHMYHIPECYNKKTDSIIIEDDYFHCVDCFVFDFLRDQHDFILRCEELENYSRIWHLERISQKASQSSSDEEKEITQENAEELTESNPEPLGDIKLSDFFSITEMLLMENSEPEWAYYHNNDLIWASSKRFSKDELLRMYANGYFMPYLTDKRKNLSRIQLKEYKTMGNTERCQNLWKQIEALDEEIARLFMNGARM